MRNTISASIYGAAAIDSADQRDAFPPGRDVIAAFHSAYAFSAPVRWYYA